MLFSKKGHNVRVFRQMIVARCSQMLLKHDVTTRKTAFIQIALKAKNLTVNFFTT